MKKLMTLLVVLGLLMNTGAWAQDFSKGRNAYIDGDYEAALQEWRPLAQQGDAVAQYWLGFIYERGDGVPQNYTEAVKWYTLAAEQGHVLSQKNLAELYENGRGVPQNYTVAVRWYKLAAEQGDSYAQFSLGGYYLLGRGVPQDYILAHMWYNLAVANDPTGGDSIAVMRAHVEADMTRDQIVRAQDLARECVAKDYKGC